MSNNYSMQQEAILAAKAKIGDILTYEWDGSSYDTTSGVSRVVDTANGAADLSRVGTSLQRKGHIAGDYRRHLYATETNASAINAGGGMNAFNNADVNLTTSGGGENAGTLDYVYTLTLSPSIKFVSDTAVYDIANTSLNGIAFNPTAVGTRTNIKAVTVTVTGAEQTISLSAFSSNIGANPQLPSRPYR